MNSPFTRKKNNASMLITLRTHYAPTQESEDLESKRQAQLKWMQENGVNYLGDPLENAERAGRRRPAVASMRVVRVGGGAGRLVSEEGNDDA